MPSPDDPQNLNRYSYVLNNPQGYIDPSGYEGEDTAGTYSIPGYGWVKVFMDLFGGDDKPERRPMRPKAVAAPVAQHKIAVKNGPETPKNVSVYDSHRYPRMQPGDDYPTDSPWLKRLWDFFSGEAHAADKDGVTFPPNPNLIHRFNLPDIVWHKDAPRQVQPGIRKVQHYKFNPKTGELEKSDVYYDQYGRQIGRTDHTVHGRSGAHTNPHHHTTEYGPGYVPKGKESGAIPGRYPGGEY